MARKGRRGERQRGAGGDAVLGQQVLRRMRPLVSGWSREWLAADARAVLPRHFRLLAQSPALSLSHVGGADVQLGDLLEPRDTPMALNARFAAAGLVGAEESFGAPGAGAPLSGEAIQEFAPQVGWQDEPLQELVTDEATAALEIPYELLEQYQEGWDTVARDGAAADPSSSEGASRTRPARRAGADSSGAGQPTRRASMPAVQRDAPAPMRAAVRSARGIEPGAMPLAPSASEQYSRLLAERIRRAQTPAPTSLPANMGVQQTQGVTGQQLGGQPELYAPQSGAQRLPTQGVQSQPAQGQAMAAPVTGQQAQVQPAPSQPVQTQQTRTQSAPAAPTRWDSARSKASAISERIAQAALARERGESPPVYNTAAQTSSASELDQRLMQGMRKQLAEREGIDPNAVGDAASTARKLSAEEAARRAERWRAFSRVEVLSTSTPAPAEEGVLPKMPPPPRPEAAVAPAPSSGAANRATAEDATVVDLGAVEVIDEAPVSAQATVGDVRGAVEGDESTDDAIDGEYEVRATTEYALPTYEAPAAVEGSASIVEPGEGSFEDFEAMLAALEEGDEAAESIGEGAPGAVEAEAAVARENPVSEPEEPGAAMQASVAEGRAAETRDSVHIGAHDSDAAAEVARIPEGAATSAPVEVAPSVSQQPVNEKPAGRGRGKGGKKARSAASSTEVASVAPEGAGRVVDETAAASPLVAESAAVEGVRGKRHSDASISVAAVESGHAHADTPIASSGAEETPAAQEGSASGAEIAAVAETPSSEPVLGEGAVDVGGIAPGAVAEAAVENAVQSAGTGVELNRGSSSEVTAPTSAQDVAGASGGEGGNVARVETQRPGAQIAEAERATSAQAPIPTGEEGAATARVEKGAEGAGNRTQLATPESGAVAAGEIGTAATSTATSADGTGQGGALQRLVAEVETPLTENEDRVDLASSVDVDAPAVGVASEPDTAPEVVTRESSAAGTAQVAEDTAQTPAGVAQRGSAEYETVTQPAKPVRVKPVRRSNIDGTVGMGAQAESATKSTTSIGESLTPASTPAMGGIDDGGVAQEGDTQPGSGEIVDPVTGSAPASEQGVAQYESLPRSEGGSPVRAVDAPSAFGEATGNALETVQRDAGIDAEMPLVRSMPSALETSYPVGEAPPTEFPASPAGAQSQGFAPESVQGVGEPGGDASDTPAQSPLEAWVRRSLEALMAEGATVAPPSDEFGKQALAYSEMLRQEAAVQGTLEPPVGGDEAGRRSHPAGDTAAGDGGGARQASRAPSGEGGASNRVSGSVSSAVSPAAPAAAPAIAQSAPAAVIQRTPASDEELDRDGAALPDGHLEFGRTESATQLEATDGAPHTNGSNGNGAKSSVRAAPLPKIDLSRPSAYADTPVQRVDEDMPLAQHRRTSAAARSPAPARGRNGAAESGRQDFSDLPMQSGSDGVQTRQTSSPAPEVVTHRVPESVVRQAYGITPPTISRVTSPVVQASAVEVVQRADTDTVTNTSETAELDTANLGEIARLVYPILKDMLRLERDRFGR